VRRADGRSGRGVGAGLPPAGDLTLSFADDLQLAVFSDGDIDRGYAWTMLGTDGLELAAGTRFGAQGYRLAWRPQG
jgi:hypothetical protein